MSKDKRLIILKQANKFFRQGKIDNAIKEYRKILELKEDDLEVRRIIGDLLIKKNSLPEAISEFEWIADYFMKEGFFTKSIAMYKRINRIDPSYEKAQFRLGELYTKEGLVSEAKQIYIDIAEDLKRKNRIKDTLNIYKKILEFDKGNAKMRMLLAESYLKEKMVEEAVNEYLTAADILIAKKEFALLEETLANVIDKIKNPRLIGKLAQCYVSLNKDDKAIALLKSLGNEVEKHVGLLKIIGEIYFKRNEMTNAEAIFKKISQAAPEEADIVLKLGKVYLQRNEYDKTFQLFSPLVDTHIRNKKFEDASTMLRFIISANNTYLPALLKLAAVFKASGKTTNLIALYESLIQILEQKGMIKELKNVLEELIELSESPFVYQDQLAKLSGKEMKKEEEEQERREEEFVTLNLKVADESIQNRSFPKALDILKKARNTFPQNIKIREKLFELYEMMEETKSCMNEGKDLLNLYKFAGQEDEYKKLLEKLSQLEPEDDQLAEINQNEGTSIDIDFGKDDLEEQFDDISNSSIKDISSAGKQSTKENVIMLGEDNIPDEHYKTEELSKSFTSIVKEIDFYISDGYLEPAEKLIEESIKKYPQNKAILSKYEKLERLKKKLDKKPAMEGEESEGGEEEIEEKEKSGSVEFELTENYSQGQIESELKGAEKEFDMGEKEPEKEQAVKESSDEVEFELTGNFSAAKDQEEAEKSEAVEEEEEEEEDIDIGLDDVIEIEPIAETAEPVSQDPDLEFDGNKKAPASDKKEISNFELDLAFKATTQEKKAPIEYSLDDLEIETTRQEDENLLKNKFEDFEIKPADLGEPQLADEKAEDLEIEHSISGEQQEVQEKTEHHEKFDLGEIRAADQEDQEIIPISDVQFETLESDEELEVEIEEPPSKKDLPLFEDERGELIVPPSSSVHPHDVKEDTGVEIKETEVKQQESRPAAEDNSASFSNFDLDQVLEKPEEQATGTESPFQDLDVKDLQENSEEDMEEAIFKEDVLLLIDENYLPVEKLVNEEIDAINFWIKEIERQRTSSAEKGMMEIFEQFKKGVDEKIGYEDFETRYNLGIAYKEMGLVEEAIHEFLIASKSTEKFFDSAGLLGMCFRDKGMFDEAAAWFAKALEHPGRNDDEYLAIKYEMVLNFKLKEDYGEAKKLIREINKINPQYRDLKELSEEIKHHLR